MEPSSRDLVTTNANASVTALLDPDSAFLELSPLAAHEVYPDNLPGAGIITGIGESTTLSQADKQERSLDGAA